MSPVIFIILPILLLSVVIHECAHGIAAYRCGDDTAKLMGRITLNPIPHIDPFWSIVIPVVMILSSATGIFIPLIAGAKPVPVNPLNFRHPRGDDIIVSFAGAFSNILLAISGFLLLIIAANLPIPIVRLKALFVLFFMYVMLLNLWLAAFNLIPIPPLDGSHILANILPYSLGRVYKQINPLMGMIILVLLISSRILFFILGPIQRLVLSAVSVVTPNNVLVELIKILQG